MEDENRPGEFYDLEVNSDKCRCVLCECNDPKAHVCYWNCPIFNDFKICATCCTIDVLRKDVEKKISEKLGRKITREEINDFCKKCGRNHAEENDDLADRLTSNSVEFTVQEDEEPNREKDKTEEDG